MAGAGAPGPNPRAEACARQFETAQNEFIALVESLTDEQWRRVGRNFPQRVNDEDEHRTVGVIAHHVAINGPWIVDRIEGMLAGRQLSPVDIKTINARHASEKSAVSRDEVLTLLRESLPDIVERVRTIPDDQLDVARETPAGPMSVAQRLERVLIGHIRMHEGSIKSAIADGDGAG